MERKTKYLHMEVKATGDDDGVFEAYGSIFGNVDAYGDIVDKGAFTKTLNDRGSKVKLLWQHDPSQPIGKFTSLSEDSVGLKVVGQLNLDVQQGKEAYALLKQGALDGMSIGYLPVQFSRDEKNKDIWHLTEVKLFEVSLVTFPANEEATVTSVKDLRDIFEQLTRDQRAIALDLLNKLKNNALSITEPPITETSVEKHSVEEKAAQEPTEEPQDVKLLEQLEAMHSLEIAVKTLERLAKQK